MPYAIVQSDPEAQSIGGPFPLGFDVFPWEVDAQAAPVYPTAIWIVAHNDDATLLAAINARGLAIYEHGSGTWDGTATTVSVSGGDMVALRAQLDDLYVALAAVAPSLLSSLRSKVNAAKALLPPDPRA